MLDNLYIEAADSTERVEKLDDAQYLPDFAIKTFEERVKARRQLSSNYFFSLFLKVLTYLCCCLKRCWSIPAFMRTRIEKHYKF